MNKELVLYRKQKKVRLNNRLNEYKDYLVNDYKLIKDINYNNDHNSYHLFDIYEPIKSNNRTIIMIHGGSYVTNKKETNDLQCRYFASKGFKVLNISYRLLPCVTIKGIIKDIFTFFNFIDKHHKKYKINLNDILLTGDSAGGHIAAISMNIFNSKKYQELYKVKLPSFKINYFAFTCPVSYSDELINPKNDLYKRINSYFDERFINRLKKDHSYNLYEMAKDVNYKNVNIFMLTSKLDTTVYPETYALHKFYLDNKIKHVYKEYESEGNPLSHVFNMTYPMYKESIKANNDIIKFFKEKQ